ncbi:MAG: cystathionine beta-lyase, partial [Gammaproteobacteria bacterium]
RGSTTIFANAASVKDSWNHDEVAYTYGLYGTPTTLELAARIAELEGGYRTFITPGGQSALALIYFAFVNAGEHALVPDSIYGPNRGLAEEVLGRYNVEVAYYDPLIGSGIEELIKGNTRLIWCESPGSVTMQIQDIPAIAEVAHRHGVTVALDNSYAAGVYFDAFKHGVDVTMQALTKYVGGHSDLFLGSVTVRDESRYRALGAVHQHLGLAASPDDCSLALRGLQTLAVRLKASEQSALAVARWLAKQPSVKTVLHPALPACPGHEIWKRDFTGSTGIFSVIFNDGIGTESIHRLLDSLKLFKIGYSWGGVTSLAVPYFDLIRTQTPETLRLVRFNIGLETADDLISDLDGAFSKLQS